MKCFLKYFLGLAFLIKSVHGAPTPPTLETSEAKPYIVYLDWFLNPHHAPLVIGVQKGFFKAQGLKNPFCTPMTNGA